MNPHDWLELILEARFPELPQWEPEPEPSPHRPVPPYLGILTNLGAVVSARQKLVGICESPIETILGSHILALGRWFFGEPYRLVLARHGQEGDLSNADIALIPQYPWRRYRIDFALKLPMLERPYFFIECDGREFHAVQQKQIDRDAARDRVCEAAGNRVFRFTGTEINRDPHSCAAVVLMQAKNAFDAERAQ